MIAQLQWFYPVVVDDFATEVEDTEGGFALVGIVDAKGFLADSDIEWDDVAFAIKRGDYGDEGKMWAVV